MHGRVGGGDSKWPWLAEFTTPHPPAHHTCTSARAPAHSAIGQPQTSLTALAPAAATGADACRVAAEPGGPAVAAVAAVPGAVAGALAGPGACSGNAFTTRGGGPAWQQGPHVGGWHRHLHGARGHGWGCARRHVTGVVGHDSEPFVGQKLRPCW